MQITVRPIHPTDRARWLGLRHALWRDEPPDELTAELDDCLRKIDGEPVFVAETPDGRLVGMIEASIRHAAPGCSTDRIGYIEGWYVEPAFRRRGIGRRLVEAAESWARGQGCSEMASDTTPAYPAEPGSPPGARV